MLPPAPPPADEPSGTGGRSKVGVGGGIEGGAEAIRPGVGDRGGGGGRGEGEDRSTLSGLEENNSSSMSLADEDERWLNDLSHRPSAAETNNNKVDIRSSKSDMMAQLLEKEKELLKMEEDRKRVENH